MFRQFILAAISLLVLGGSATTFAMKADNPEDFYVTVRNNYGAQIEVSFVLAGKAIIKVVNLDLDATLGLASNISGDIKIYRAGALVGHLAAGFTLPAQALGQLWAQQRKQPIDNTLLLTVTPALGRLVVSYRPTQQSTLTVMVEIKKLEGGVMDQFPGLEKYGLEKKLTPDQILAIRSPNEVVIPGGWIVGRATTGEDIARYILELPIGYNAASVQAAYKKLSLQWHPDKQKLEGMKETAAQVFTLITHAKDLLTQALGDRCPA